MEGNVLHSPTEAALAFPDGLRFYAWRGQKMPSKYYESEVSAKEILQERNMEIRRALAERYDVLHGAGNFIKDAGAKLLDSSVQPMLNGQPDCINELLELDAGVPMMYLRIIDPSTGRVYVLQVDPELRPMIDDWTLGKPQKKTVHNAIASTFGLRGEEYCPERES